MTFPSPAHSRPAHVDDLLDRWAVAHRFALWLGHWLAGHMPTDDLVTTWNVLYPASAVGPRAEYLAALRARADLHPRIPSAHPVVTLLLSAPGRPAALPDDVTARHAVTTAGAGIVISCGITPTAPDADGAQGDGVGRRNGVARREDAPAHEGVGRRDDVGADENVGRRDTMEAHESVDRPLLIVPGTTAEAGVYTLSGRVGSGSYTTLGEAEYALREATSTSAERIVAAGITPSSAPDIHRRMSSLSDPWDDAGFPLSVGQRAARVCASADQVSATITATKGLAEGSNWDEFLLPLLHAIAAARMCAVDDHARNLWR